MSKQVEDLVEALDFGELNLTSQDEDILDEAAGHIQENLEDELVQEALKKVPMLSRTPWGGGRAVGPVCVCVCVCVWPAIGSPLLWCVVVLVSVCILASMRGQLAN